jgi:hypothetical protein
MTNRGTKKFSTSFGCVFGTVILTGLFAVAAASCQAGSITYKFSADLTSGGMGGQFTLDSGAITAFDFVTPKATIDSSNAWFAMVFVFAPHIAPKRTLLPFISAIPITTL